jgi:hypothetical protein
MIGIDDAIAQGLKIFNKFIPDKGQQAEFENQYRLALLEADTRIVEAQLEVNKAEAENPNLFASCWRPFIGWICGIAMAYHFILQPLLIFLLSINGQLVTLPSFNMDSLNTVLFGMLGLGGMRSYEKVKGVTK